MSFICFSSLKARISIEDVANHYQITLKGDGVQKRAQCPKCEGSDRGLAINTREQSWYCHQDKKGGDVISLVAHLEGCRMKQAAERLVSIFPEDKPKETPRDKPGFDHQKIAQSLKYDHPDVLELGLDPETAESLMVGFKPKGLHQGAVVFPLYRDGQCVGFAGFKGGELRLPKI